MTLNDLLDLIVQLVAVEGHGKLPVAGLTDLKLHGSGRFLEPVFGAVDESAFVTGQPVRILYRDKSGTISDRVVVPYAAENGVLTAFCRLRNEDRTFLLSRILLAAPPDDIFPTLTEPVEVK